MKSNEQIAIEKMRDCIADCAVFFNKIRDRIQEEDESFKAADDSVTAIISACVSPSGITHHQSKAEQRSELPRRPWIASNQHGMHFILSQDNHVLWRADWLPMGMLQEMVKAANEYVEKGIK